MVSLAAHLVQCLPEVLNSRPYQPSVGLNLRFSRPPCPDAAAQAFEVRPLSGKAWHEVLVLGQLHLQTAFAGLGPRGKDVEDQRGTVDDLDVLVEGPFEVALLRWRQLVVADDRVDALGLDDGLQLFQLAFAQVMMGWLAEVLREIADNHGARSTCEFREFCERGRLWQCLAHSVDMGAQ